MSISCCSASELDPTMAVLVLSFLFLDWVFWFASVWVISRRGRYWTVPFLDWMGIVAVGPIFSNWTLSAMVTRRILVIGPAPFPRMIMRRLIVLMIRRRRTMEEAKKRAFRIFIVIVKESRVREICIVVRNMFRIPVEIITMIKGPSFFQPSFHTKRLES